MGALVKYGQLHRVTEHLSRMDAGQGDSELRGSLMVTVLVA
jgi:hypothetical protein